MYIDNPHTTKVLAEMHILLERGWTTFVVTCKCLRSRATKAIQRTHGPPIDEGNDHLKIKTTC